MPLPILDSPFLTLPVLDRILLGTTDPVQRVQLLAARVTAISQAADADKASKGPVATTSTTDTNTAAITSSSSQPTPPAPTSRSAPPDPTPLLNARLALADAHLRLQLPDLHAAETEALAVDGECRRLSKAARRWGGGSTTTATGGNEGREGEESAGDGARDGDGKVARAATAPTTTGTNSDAAPPPAWIADLPALRVRALRILVDVEEGLGRPARAERWRKLADELESK